MKHFFDYLQGIGYKPHRFNGQGWIETPLEKALSFSTVEPYGLAMAWIDEKDNMIRWGLSEAGLPPTLLSPRPVILHKTQIGNDIRCVNVADNDHVMNYVLANYAPSFVYDAIASMSNVRNIDLSNDKKFMELIGQVLPPTKHQ